MENELKVWKTVGQLAQEALSKYSTSAEQDYDLLQKDREEGTLSNNERNCIKFRQNEKITLDILSSASFMIIKLLTMEDSDASEYAQSLPEFI